MRTLLGAMRDNAAGEPIPHRILPLLQEDIQFRTGELTMLAAAPGGCKTVLALTIAAFSQVPTLYFSPDTSVGDISSRLASMITHDEHSIVQSRLVGNRHYYDAAIHTMTNHIRWDFTPQPSVRDLEEETEAFAMLYGDYPHLLVLDNLRNLITGADSDTTGFRYGMEGLAALSRNTGSAVIVLHHLVGEAHDGQPPRLSQIEGKVSHHASLILGLSVWHDFDGFGSGERLCLSVLKNRSGKADPAGKYRIFLEADLARMSLF